MSTVETTDLKTPKSWLTLGVFLLIVIGIGGLIGASTAPGEWYASLEKPPFNPPNWVFGPVWFALYVLIAIAGWRTFLADPTGLGMKLWGAQMLLNWAWSPTWFTLQLVWPAFAIIVCLLAAILAFIANRWQRDRLTAWLFVPYAAWVAFASVLNLSIGILN